GARTAGRLRRGSLLLLVLLPMTNGCECRAVGPRGWLLNRQAEIKVALAKRCNVRADCFELVCQQGPVCMNRGFSEPGYCDCAETRFRPCVTAADCGPDRECIYYPHSVRGSCETKLPIMDGGAG